MQCFVEGKIIILLIRINTGNSLYSLVLRPRTNWMSNIIEWKKSDIGDLLENTLDREKWKKTCIGTCILIAAIKIPPTTYRSRDKGYVKG